jgi:hypothetical protein
MEISIGEPSYESAEKVDIVRECIFFVNWSCGSSDNTPQPVRLSWYTSFVGVVGNISLGHPCWAFEAFGRRLEPRMAVLAAWTR